MMDNIFPKIHKEGYKFLAISIIFTLAVLLFSNFFGIIFIVITIWVYYFSETQTGYQLTMITIWLVQQMV